MDPRYSEFFNLFNAQKFFEAHEVLEGLWREEKGSDKDFYQGLIQIAAAFVHVQNKNSRGARDLMNKAVSHLSQYPDQHHGLHIPTVLSTAQKAAAAGQFPVFFPK